MSFTEAKVAEVIRKRLSGSGYLRVSKAVGGFTFMKNERGEFTIHLLPNTVLEKCVKQSNGIQGTFLFNILAMYYAILSGIPLHVLWYCVIAFQQYEQQSCQDDKWHIQKMVGCILWLE